MIDGQAQLGEASEEFAHSRYMCETCNILLHI